MENQKEKFSGWIVMIVLFIISFIGQGLSNTLSSFTPYLTDDYGISRAAFQVTWSLQSLVAAGVSMFLFGPLVKKFDVKVCGITGLILMTVSYLIFWKADNLPMFYIAGALFGFGGAISSSSFFTTVTARWFVKNRGLLTGIVVSATGFGGTLMNKIFTPRIETEKQTIFLIYGILCLVIAVITFFGLKESPEKYGQKPFGWGEVVEEIKKEKTQKKVKREKEFTKDITLKEATRQPFFWCMIIGSVIFGFTSYPLCTVLPARLVDLQFSAELMGSIVSLFYLIIGFWKIIFGFIYDRCGAVATWILTGVPAAAGIWCFAMAGGPEDIALVYVFVFMFSNYVAAQSAQFPYAITSVFGSKNVAKFIGVCCGLMAFSSVFGSQTLASVFDMTGSYNAVLTVYPVLLVIATACFCFAVILSQKYLKNNSAE